MTVAVIDIGSNSIKSLAATRDAQGGLVVLQAAVRDVRISAGLSRTAPLLADAGMRAGLDAVRRLLAELAPLRPDRVALVATSAVRGAGNAAEFAALVKAGTGHALRILDGAAEAELIGLGLLSDPALADLRDFHLFDLGGGSLECLAFRERRPVQVVSLPLGCVRLTERCVPDSKAPFDARSRAAVMQACRDAFAPGVYRFDQPAGAPAIFTGGTVTTVRSILAERRGSAPEPSQPVVAVDLLRTLLDETAALTLDQRKQMRGLPPARADVFPTALATVLTVAELGGFAAFLYSSHNLRYGIAAELLGADSC